MPLFDYQDEIVEAPPAEKGRGEQRTGNSKKRSIWRLFIMMAVVFVLAFLIIQSL